MSENIEHVIDSRGYALMGDSRGITVDWQLRESVWKWAVENGIVIEYQGSLGGQDLWYVKDDQHRTWFTLKWKK